MPDQIRDALRERRRKRGLGRRDEIYSAVEFDTSRNSLEREFDILCTALESRTEPPIADSHGRQDIPITEAITLPSTTSRKVRQG